MHSRVPNDRRFGYKPKRAFIEKPLRFAESKKIAVENSDESIPRDDPIENNDILLYPGSKINIKEAISIIEEQCSLNNLSEERRYYKLQ